MPTPFEIPAEKSFIGGWFIDDLAACDALISYFERAPNRTPGCIVKVGGNAVVDKSVKDSVELSFAPHSLVPEFLGYYAELKKAVDAYVALYPFCNEYAPWRIVQPVNLQFYPPGGGYKNFHTERMTAVPPGSTRHLVFMTFLNDVHDGGGTEFLHQKVTVPARKGLTLIWPADWTHTHRGIVSPTETKYIITGWYNYVEVDT